MSKGFADQVAAWAKKAEAALDEVVARSAHDVLAAAQRTEEKGGRMPVDTGELVESLEVSINGVVVAKGEEAALGALRMKAGDDLLGVWTAPHAAHVEYGTAREGEGGQPREPAAFLRGAVDQWPAIVKKNSRKAAKKAAKS